jgi:signal transduction histidine kinase
VVTDHGIGFDPAQQTRVFDRYARAASARHFGGLGLGLHICRQIVEAHGGTITGSGTPGVGARFSVELPQHGAFTPSD